MYNLPRFRGSPRARIGALLAVVGLVMAACTDKAVGPEDVSGISITPARPPALTSLGETLQLTAKAVSGSSEQVSTTINWSSSDEDVVTVDKNGLVTAIGNGTAFVRASVGKVRDSVAVTVHQVVTATVKVAGDEQIDEVGATLPVRIEVELRDAGGSPVAGRELSFEASNGGSAPNATTDEAGHASTSWTLGTIAGAQMLHVLEAGTGTLLTSFTATVKPLAAAAIELVAGDGQTAYAGFALRDEIVVRVVDSLGNAKDGVLVTFTVSKGNGSVSPTTMTSREDGTASTRWTIGSDLDTQELAITAEGLTDTLRVTATLDRSASPTPGRTFMLLSNATASPGDTITVLLTADLTGLDPEAWGAIIGVMTWNSSVFRLVNGISYAAGDLVNAGITSAGDLLVFVVSRPLNDERSGDILMVRLEVQPGATGTHRIEFGLEDLVSARTFNHLLSAVDAVGTTVRIVP